MLKQLIKSRPSQYQQAKALVKRAMPQKLAVRMSDSVSTIHQKYLENFVFIHIPKCGGTSVERALGIPLLNHDTAIERRDKLGAKTMASRPCFTVVRNPFYRMASLYYYWERKSGTALELRSDYVRWLHYIREQLTHSEPKKHIRTQWWWIADENGESMMDLVCRLESIDDDIQRVSQLLGKEIPLSRINKRSSVGSYEQLYVAESKSIVLDLYQEDFERFGYEPHLEG